MAEQKQIRTKRRSRRCTRFRVGKVSIYEHHGSWWVYYREGDRQVRRRVGSGRGTAEKLASDVNGQIAINAPTTFSFSPLSVGELRTRFLQHHEVLLQSSLATVNRYRAVTQHLVDYLESQALTHKAHEISATAFLLFLRQREVSPNGHDNTPRRKLRDKGLRYVLGVCRSMYAYAAKHQHLPPNAANPFASLSIDRLRVSSRMLRVVVASRRYARRWMRRSSARLLWRSRARARCGRLAAWRRPWEPVSRRSIASGETTV